MEEIMDKVLEYRRRPPEKLLHLDRRVGRLIAEGEQEGGDDLLNTDEVGEWLGIAKSTLEGYRSRGVGPPFIVITAGMVRYRRGAVLAWLLERERRQIEPTAMRGRRAGRRRGSRVINGRVVPPGEVNGKRIVLKRPS
jgi:hypothetical protein